MRVFYHSLAAVWLGGTPRRPLLSRFLFASLLGVGMAVRAVVLVIATSTVATGSTEDFCSKTTCEHEQIRRDGTSPLWTRRMQCEGDYLRRIAAAWRRMPANSLAKANG